MDAPQAKGPLGRHREDDSDKITPKASEVFRVGYHRVAPGAFALRGEIPIRAAAADDDSVDDYWLLFFFRHRVRPPAEMTEITLSEI